MNNPEQPQMNIDFSQTTESVCEKCKNDTFIQVYKMRKLSALLSPSGEEAMIPVQGYACAKCNHVNKEFLIKEN
tara:strand:+ start:324 stop:545 length:222 start_codon:yes stop_codon:yes gene_type:complete